MPAHRPRRAAGGTTRSATPSSMRRSSSGTLWERSWWWCLPGLKQQNSACSLFPLLLPPGLVVEGAGPLQAWSRGASVRCLLEPPPARDESDDGLLVVQHLGLVQPRHAGAWAGFPSGCNAPHPQRTGRGQRCSSSARAARRSQRSSSCCSWVRQARKPPMQPWGPWKLGGEGRGGGQGARPNAPGGRDALGEAASHKCTPAWSPPTGLAAPAGMRARPRPARMIPSLLPVRF